MKEHTNFVWLFLSILQNARDPINGFVIKTRTDDTRKLVPQKVLLKPVVGTVYGARFQNPVDAGEYIGDTTGTYDPYKKRHNRCWY